MSGSRSKKLRRQGGKGRPLTPERARELVRIRQARLGGFEPPDVVGAGVEIAGQPVSAQSRPVDGPGRGPDDLDQDDLMLPPRAGAPGAGTASPGSSSLTFVECFDTVFRDWFAGDSWGVWRVVAKSIFGEPLEPAELERFTKHTGRTIAQSTPAREVWLCCGRRAGKDYFVAALVVWLACVRRYRFSTGELGRVMLLAVDSDQADILYTYVTELVDSIPQFKRLVVRRSVKFGMRRIEFKTGTEILIKPADKRRVRGRTIVAVVADEVAHWFSEEHHANPDKEVLRALRPGMLGVPGAMLIAISSPYRRQGELYETDQRVWGRNNEPTLFWRAATWEMRYPMFYTELCAELDRDLSFFKSEYGAEYRVDLEDYLTREQLDAVTVDRTEIPFQVGMRCHAFIDTSGGEGQDSQALCITVELGDQRGAVARLIEWRPPFDSAASARQVAELCREYKIAKVCGDKFGGAMFSSMLKTHGIGYDPETRTATELYRGFASVVTGKKVELLGAGATAQRALAQLMRLERRHGGEKITHPDREHDDVANAIAGAALLACRPSGFDPIPIAPWNRTTARTPAGPVVDSLGTRYVGDGTFIAKSGERFRDPRGI